MGRSRLWTASFCTVVWLNLPFQLKAFKYSMECSQTAYIIRDNGIFTSTVMSSSTNPTSPQPPTMESLTDENLPAQGPIQRLPLALLSKIIHESVDENKFGQYTIPFSNDVCVQSEAVNIGLISRRWRHVSLLIPEIWSCITLKIEGGEEDPPGLLRALDTHIQRSKDVPLRVNVKLSGTFRYDDEYPALGKLLSHAHRWVELALTVDEFEDAFEEEYYLFLYLISQINHTPLLHSLRIESPRS
ncbi:hypothetical protein PM082_011918 [Marasmius tenuissimus]|nr:hypothetical protein PM082_011918 [Marasmius tenuissimus]